MKCPKLKKMLNYDLHATEMMTAYDQMWAVFADGRPIEAFNVNGTQVSPLHLASHKRSIKW